MCGAVPVVAVGVVTCVTWFWADCRIERAWAKIPGRGALLCGGRYRRAVHQIDILNAFAAVRSRRATGTAVGTRFTVSRHARSLLVRCSLHALLCCCVVQEITRQRTSDPGVADRADIVSRFVAYARSGQYVTAC